MANPLYESLLGRAAGPLQNFTAMMQAMRNPAEFVKQQFPDIPEQIQNNPYQILQYLQQTRGITNQQIQQAQEMSQQIPGVGSVQ